MCVSPNPSNVSLYIKNAIHVRGNTAITQQGTTIIGGDFYHDATTTVFEEKDDGTFPSKGKIVFSKDHNERRLITTKDDTIINFNRGNYYIAFPEIEIETADTVVVSSLMGIDAIKIMQTTDRSGKLLLESNSLIVSEESEPLEYKTYDASLRITGTKEAEDTVELVPPGAVIVERDLTPYRVADQANLGSGLLFAFASPFTNQRSGYFAGNWIRQMLETDNGHVQYVYGNKQANGTILREQYIINPTDMFTAGKGYLIKLRAKNFNYSQLGAGLEIIRLDDGVNYDQDKFVFNGKPYTLPKTDEQLFVNDTLFHRTLDLDENNATINWIIGNSYTAPINVSALINQMGSSTLQFEPNLYVLPQGNPNYQIYKMQPNSNSMQVINIDEIPSMSYFMIRLTKRTALQGGQKGTLTLTRNDLLRHGTAPHNTLRGTETTTYYTGTTPYHNEIVFRISPESNHNIYDLAGIGLRQNGNPNADSNDIDKMLGSNELFSIYTEAPDGKKLSANILPETTTSVPLFVTPGQAEGQFHLQVSRMESLQTDGLWLEDLIERKTYDLVEQNGRHSFYSTPNDPPGRFIVHFRQTTTGIEEKTDAFLSVYYHDGQLKIRGLDRCDVGSTLRIINLQGQTVQSKTITQTPETNIDIHLPSGIYIAKLDGKRSVTVKFKK